MAPYSVTDETRGGAAGPWTAAGLVHRASVRVFTLRHRRLGLVFITATKKIQVSGCYKQTQIYY